VQTGDSVLLRSIYGGRVRWTFPHHLAGTHADGRIALYCMPGNHGKVIKTGADDDAYLERWVRGDPPRDHRWERTHVLRFVRAGDAHTIEIYWDESWAHLGWYVNLQAPLVVDGTRFDTTDWALDVVVDPDGTWRWKDEDDLAGAVDLGVFDDAGAAAVRAEGERVIAERPWPTGWERWRPPREWSPLPLPEDWDRV
jgi:hypothetical protein